MRSRAITIAAALVLLSSTVAARAQTPEERRLILPGQRHIDVRSPERLPSVAIPAIPPPRTVDRPGNDLPVLQMSLDEAIRTALANTRVVRVLVGAQATSTGSTIYDPAVTNTEIDTARAQFDPTVTSTNQFFHTEQPAGVITNPGPPPQVDIRATPVQGFTSRTGVNKQFLTGATAGVNVNVDQARADAAGLPLNPQAATSTSLSLTQPLLQGAGFATNQAPILIARIDTERSFFQMKDSVQEMVRSVEEGYWQLVFAQVQVWSSEQQTAQGKEALDRAEARLGGGLVDVSEPAQARVAYERFRAALVQAQANLIQREAALRDVMGLPPADLRRIVPSTPLSIERHKVAWDDVLARAETYRPDVVELKLVLEADQQQIIIARNTALPRLDATALYRWNGLEGHTPDGTRIEGDGFQDWQLGVNFSVPLGLRRERAGLRQRELMIMRDRAQLDQTLHQAGHTLASSLRNLDQFYAQFQAFHRMREAAEINLERQRADYLTGRRTLYLNVLQAITDWGSAVNSECQALALYNAELANLERQAGTILESHGVRFYEERYRSIGPLGEHFDYPCFPRGMRPGPNAEKLPTDPEQVYRLPEMVALPPVDELPALSQPSSQLRIVTPPGPNNTLPPPGLRPSPILPAPEAPLPPDDGASKPN